MSLGTVDDAEFQAWANRVRGKIDSNFVKKEISKSTKRIGIQAIKQLKANTPVESGDLRRAWTAEGLAVDGGGWVVKVINNTDYASYVERGHRQTPGRFVPAIGKRLKASWVPGQFFMRDSMNIISAQLPELITPGLWAFRDLLS